MDLRDNLSAKQRALQMIEQLPDDATLEDMMYGLYVIERIDAGLRDIEVGRTIPHEEVVRSLDEWLKPRDEMRDA